MNMRSKVHALQDTLSRAVKQSLHRKFGALYDKVYCEEVLWEAWKRVRVHQGAPGVDEQSFVGIEDEIGVERFLLDIQEELHEQSYRPLPVRRCWIDKPGKPEKRPLGIPVIKDRVVQMAVKLVIEPIFETNFLPCSYGFRSGRSASQALREAQRTITFQGRTLVIDADIKGCFDAIPHDRLMNLVRRRISDPRLLKLIRGWLKAGIMEDGRYIESEDAGTPQGGVISPLLANIHLHAFDKMWEQSKFPGTLVRYCDDFVILLPPTVNAAWILHNVREMLGRLGLELHPKKTGVRQARDGFDFLGVHLRLCRVRKPNAKLTHSCRLWPSDRSMERVKQRIRDLIGRRYSTTLEDLIAELNPVLRGWNAYHASVCPERKRLRKLNTFIRERFRIFLKRKYSDPTRGSRRVQGNLLVRLGLFQFV
jgi:RNA-directed DNA polymerase